MAVAHRAARLPIFQAFRGRVFHITDREYICMLSFILVVSKEETAVKTADLTRQQYRVLSHVFDRVRERGYPLTFREICDR